MTLNAMSALWARTALVWFVGAMLLGMYLGMTQQFHMSSPHAHMGLLGWVSSALFAFLYALCGAEEGLPKRARAHWFVHNLGAATMVVALFLTIRSGGDERLGAFIPIGGVMVILGAVWLAVMLWPRLRAG